jgi:hypothetical protein
VRSIHLIFVLAALTCGLTAALWRASGENARLEQASYASKIESDTAQYENQDLKARLPREIKAREFAEAAQRSAESAERLAREKLAQEAQMRQAVEAHRRLTEAAFADETAARKFAEGALFTAESQVRLLSSKLAEEITAREAAEARSAHLLAIANAPRGNEKILAPAAAALDGAKSVKRVKAAQAKAKVASARRTERTRQPRWTWVA